MKEKVKVLVPIYKETLGEKEMFSLKNNVSLLKGYPVVILAPEGLDVSNTLKEVPLCSVMYVSKEWLGKNGIAGYNRMMLSGDFYKMFEDCSYILICQTDAWVFSDDLEKWCNKSYDYVGAPWPKRKVYDFPPIKFYMWLRKKMLHKEGKIMRQDYFYKVGNGGFSLRKVSSFIKACDTYKERIEEFNNNRGMIYNEDWFWALVPKEFRYPSFNEALGFSYDSHPDLCMELNNGKLPFGCHGWFKKRNYDFWKKFIEK